MTDRILELLRLLIGLGIVTSLAEALLPQNGVFRSARIAIGTAYIAALFSELAVILSEIGG